jgi:hypothetical protein
MLKHAIQRGNVDRAVGVTGEKLFTAKGAKVSRRAQRKSEIVGAALSAA